MSHIARALPSLVLTLSLLPTGHSAFAQELASVAGTVRDTSGGAMPGVLVEAASPALIEKVRSTITDSNGQYRIAGLPVGTYTLTFSLTSFTTTQRQNIRLTSGFTASVDAQMSLGNVSETIVVAAETPTIDVQNVRQATVFTGDDLRELPNARNVSSIMNLVPGITFQTGVFNATASVCVGGLGVWCSPNVYSFNAHTSQLDGDGLRQGRLMVDGMVLNTASNPVSGALGGYIADLTNAQEVTFSLSGALGESETGGTTINIVPRSGGNRFSGSYYTHYTQKSWFGTNGGTHSGNPVTGAPAAQTNRIVHDHDVSGSFGGPIRRDRLWFYATARTQGKEQNLTQNIYYNRNAGIWGKNYQPDRSAEPLNYKNMWRNASTKLTWQATRLDKFNFMWDEQDACQDPCDGTVATYWSPEAMWSVHTFPNRVVNLTWTNPFTSRLLFEGGVNGAMQHYVFTKHRYLDNPQNIPQINETGVTAGLDEVATRLNQDAGNPGLALRSGSIGSANVDNYDNWRTRLSASYITGTHNAKVGWEGNLYSQKQNVYPNDPRLVYTYTTPAATCFNAGSPSASTCGNTSLHFPDDPYNSVRRPVPTSAQISTGDRAFDERIFTQALYIQDQWTRGRFTLNGALRYDYASSGYGATCLEPDIFVTTGYCTPESDGVRYHNLTPRWSAAWDVFGDGRTAIKWNMGKYLAAAGFQDTYQGANPARRTLNTLTRNWDDLNGNRMVDCDWNDPAAHATLGDTCGAVNAQNFRRFGKDPYLLDDTGDAIGLNTTHCGRTESGIPAAVREYCARSGQDLLSGWDKRRSEWQFGIGIQRELLPRLSAEVTYNQRWYQNQTHTDELGVGCDLYAADTEQCMSDMLAFRATPQYDFYGVRAPSDPRLPNGGGYMIRGLSNQNTAAGPSGPEAITRQPYTYGWRGIDTNFVYRMRGGLRVNGGTSTGKSFRDTCSVIDTPNVRRREGREDYLCNPWRPWQTNIRATASYTIPWIDVLASMTFQSRPGVERSANMQFTYRDLVWEPTSAYRATNSAGCPTTGAGAAPVGCLYGATVNNNNLTVNLLDASDMYGERISYADVKFGKNFRFANKRLNVGVDIYNFLNSDAVLGYINTYTVDNPSTPDVEPNLWGTPNSLIAPRYARLTLQLDF